MTDSAPSAVAEPEVGSYFVAPYPPFSVWSAEAVERNANPALQAPPNLGTPLGLYLHIPFCRRLVQGLTAVTPSNQAKEIFVNFLM